MPNPPGNPNLTNPDLHPGVKFSSEYQPESNGRPKGSLSRSTIAKKVLAMQGVLPDEMLDALKTIFPEIEKIMTFEEIGTLKVAASMVQGDIAAYKAIMDSAYGLPKSEVEHSGSMEITGITLDIKRNRDE